MFSFHALLPSPAVWPICCMRLSLYPVSWGLTSSQSFCCYCCSEIPDLQPTGQILNQVLFHFIGFSTKTSVYPKAHLKCNLFIKKKKSTLSWFPIFHSFKVKSFTTLILPFMLIVCQTRRQKYCYFHLFYSIRQCLSLLSRSLIFVDLGFINESSRIRDPTKACSKLCYYQWTNTLFLYLDSSG